MVYNCIMPITFLNSASTSEQSTFTLIQLYLLNKTMHHSKQLLVRSCAIEKLKYRKKCTNYGAERQKSINSVVKIQCNYILCQQVLTVMGTVISYIQLCHCRAWHWFTWLWNWPVHNPYYTYIINAVLFEVAALYVGYS